MILDTHTNAKVLTSEYKRTLKEAVIDRDRVSSEELAWLDIPDNVGNGQYDNIQRGWMDNPDWRGAKKRYTPLDGPGHKGVEP